MGAPAPIIDALERRFDETVAQLVALARIPGVSAPGFAGEELERSADAVAAPLDRTGLERVETLRVPGAHPYVLGEWLGARSGPRGTERRLATAGREEPVPVSDEPTLRPRRLAWAELLRCVFAVDVLECPRCGGPVRLLATIHSPDVTQAILGCLELPSRAPPEAPAVPDPEERPGDFEATL